MTGHIYTQINIIFNYEINVYRRHENSLVPFSWPLGHFYLEIEFFCCCCCYNIISCSIQFTTTSTSGNRRNERICPIEYNCGHYKCVYLLTAGGEFTKIVTHYTLNPFHYRNKCLLNLSNSMLSYMKNAFLCANQPINWNETEISVSVFVVVVFISKKN